MSPIVDTNGNQIAIISFYSQDSILGKLYKYIFKSPFTHVTFTLGNKTYSHAYGLKPLWDCNEYWDLYLPVIDIVMFTPEDKFKYNNYAWSFTNNCMHEVSEILNKYGLQITRCYNLRRFYRQLRRELRRSGSTYKVVRTRK